VPQPQPHGCRPRLDHQLTRRLGGSNAGARLTARDTPQLCYNEFPRLEETKGRRTSPDDFAQRDNAQRTCSLHILTTRMSEAGLPIHLRGGGRRINETGARPDSISRPINGRPTHSAFSGSCNSRAEAPRDYFAAAIPQVIHRTGSTPTANIFTWVMLYRRLANQPQRCSGSLDLFPISFCLTACRRSPRVIPHEFIGKMEPYITTFHASTLMESQAGASLTNGSAWI
jgi:hypothetical protein